MPSLTLVPLRHNGFNACWVVPMLPHHAWATRQGIPYGRAVLVECELDPDGRLPVYTSDQSWPADTIRYASGLGYEPSVDTAGVPAVGASILSNQSSYVII